MQYALTDRLTLRGGYLFNTNPIPAPGTLFNIQAPAITQHTVSMGASFAVSKNITASLAWVHGFDNSIQGSILQIPGSTVRLTTQTDSIVMGINMTIGGRKKVAIPEPIPFASPAAEPPTIPLPPLPTLPGDEASVTSLDATDTSAADLPR
jgi:long-chain fatty acid transport protein